jgi:SsrA-binding protein
MPILAVNKRATYDYEILERFEAGLVLTGPEVKSAKLGHVQLKGSYVTVSNGVASVINMHIGKYAPAGLQPSYNPTRTRALLLKKKEIDYLIGKRQEQGLTLIALKAFTQHNRVKLEFGLGRGKKKFDKRESIKKHEVKRDLRRKFAV